MAPSAEANSALALLLGEDSVLNVVMLPGAARKPDGDVILCDVTPEDASVVIGDLKQLGIPSVGSIAIERVDSEISDAGGRAERHAPGLASDAVVWEEVESRTSENIELSWNFMAFMVVAVLIAMAAIFLDSPVLVVGAMVVGPEFGPLAGLCVALVQRQRDTAKRSFRALIVAFPIAIAVGFVASLVIKELGLAPDGFPSNEPRFTDFITHPDFFSFLVAGLAGTAGVLSLTSSKSGPLIGVLISVTTIPAAANIGVAGAYANWRDVRGAGAQLSVNLTMIVLAGVSTLYIQRRLYERRRTRHERVSSSTREPGGGSTAWRG